MFDKIISFSIRNKLIIGLFTLILVVWGIYSLRQLPIDAVPDITNNQVLVITNAPSQSAGDIERLVTFPIEQSVATIPGITEVRSFSRFGLSVVTIVFKDQIDPYWARQQVGERLTEARELIPAGVGTPKLGPVTTGLGEIYQYVIHARKGYEGKYSPMELRTIQDWIVRRQLLGTEGVADVSSFGGYLKQYEIAVNTEKLRSLNVSIAEVNEALQRNNQNTGGAYIDNKPYAYFIRSQGLITSLADIESILVRTSQAGVPILIRDVATVQYGHATRYGAMTRNAEGEVVGAVVMMLKGANSSLVIKKVNERIAQIEKTLPPGLVIEPFLDRTKLVDHAISTVTKNLIEGALIVIFVLVLLLGNLRAGLIVASVIPLAMLFAISLMNVFGVSGNLMSLGAIDFGLIVDGAVIIVEATMYHLSGMEEKRRLTKSEMDAEVLESAIRIRKAAAFGEIIILIVYLPILALQGVEGKMFRPMAETVSFAIIGAFILSLTYVPMMSALLLSRNTVHRRTVSDRFIDWLHGGYQPLLLKALDWKKSVVAISFGLFLVSLFLFSTLGAEFLPTLNEGDFAVETRVMTGSSISETVEAAQKASALLLKKFPDEVKEVIGKIGASEIATDPMPVEACDLIIVLKDKKEWKKAGDMSELADQMSKALEDLPGVTFGFQQPIQMRFNELMTGARQDVVIKIFGEDLDLLSAYAKKLARIAQGISGAKDLYVEQATGLSQIVVTFNRDLIARYGLSVEAVNAAINTAFAGQIAGQVYEQERRFDLVVRLDEKGRHDLNDVRSLNISTKDGQQIPLSQLATIRFEVGPNQIQRDDAKRRIIVGFNVRGRDVESIVKELRQKAAAQLKMQPGYYLTFGGAFENLQQARTRLSIAVPVALLLIFLLLYFTFDSIRQSLLIYTAIPLSAIGGILALWLRGMPFSISAAVGFIALFGVAVLNGIVLIAAFNQIRKEDFMDEGPSPGLTRKIILKGTRTRLRPVIMTAAVASLGFLPMALSGGSGAEVQKPLATVVIGGLVSATLLTLFVLPCLYALFSGSKRKNTAIKTLCLLSGIFLYGATEGKAQSLSPTLQAYISSALQHNPAIQSSAWEVSQSKAMEGSYLDLAKTSLLFQQEPVSGGNSANSIGFIQSFSLPPFYHRQRQVLRTQTEIAKSSQRQMQSELIRNVCLAYNNFLYAQARVKVLAFQDSVYSQFSEKAALRYKTGETSKLEQLTALNRYQEVQLQLQMALADRQNSGLLLFQLSRLTVPGTSSDSLVALALPEAPDSADLAGNPVLEGYQQQRQLAENRRKLEKARLLPDVTLGYSQQLLIKGWNPAGADREYSPGTRIGGVQAGIGIPLFFGAYKARMAAEKAGAGLAASRLEAATQALGTQYLQAYQDVLKYRQSISYFESGGLAQTDEQIRIAAISFRLGEIGYLEWVQHMSLAVQTRLQYLSSLNQYNLAIIQLNFLKGTYTYEIQK